MDRGRIGSPVRCAHHVTARLRAGAVVLLAVLVLGSGHPLDAEDETAEEVLPPSFAPDARDLRQEVEKQVKAQPATPAAWVMGASPRRWIRWAEPHELVPPGLGEEPDVVVAPLRDALFRIAAVERNATDWQSIVPELGPATWAGTIHEAHALVEKTLLAVRDERQSAAGLADLSRSVAQTVRFLLFDRMWEATASAGLVLDVESFGPLEAPRLTQREFRDLVERMHELADVSPPWVLTMPGEVEYAFAFSRDLLFPYEDDVPFYITPLVRAQVHVDRMTAFVEAEVAEGRADAAALWAPTLAKARAVILRGLFDLETHEHSLAALEHRFRGIEDRVSALFLQRLWDVRGRDHRIEPLWGDRRVRIVRDPRDVAAVPAGRPIQVMVEDGVWVEEPHPAMYQTTTKRVCVEPGHWEERDGERKWIPPKYEEVEEQVCVQPEGVTRRLVGGKYVQVEVAEAFGDVRHLWFIKRFAYETRKRCRPEHDAAWDGMGALPPQPPWVDLLVNPDVLVRRREPLREGYILLVGTKGARGPEPIEIEGEGRIVFRTRTRSYD